MEQIMYSKMRTLTGQQPCTYTHAFFTPVYLSSSLNWLSHCFVSSCKIALLA